MAHTCGLPLPKNNRDQARVGLINLVETAWICLNQRERRQLLDALTALSSSRIHDAADIEALALKVRHSAPYPEITVGVEGGQVQWMKGNPFPIRVCDYDAPNEEALPDIDERGRPCEMWWEQADSDFTSR